METIERRNILALQGKYCKDCIIYTEDVEDEAVETVGDLLGNPLFRDTRIRVMPDVHQGKGIVIGFTCPVTSFINPQHVGLDIGCGIDLELFDRPLDRKDYALFEHRLRMEIPSGFNINRERQFEMKPFLKYLRQELSSARQSSGGLVNHLELTGERELEDWIRSVGMDKGVFYKSVGSIGGGNHFMEYDEGDGRFAFTVHTGSRHLGLKVFNKWDRIAQRNPNAPGYLVDENLKGYLTDMVIAQAYARFNREVVLGKAAKIMHKINGARVEGYIRTTHNYVDFRDMILRKGAIRSYARELMVIPFNMRDGIVVCEGRSNPEWNFSAPHGSGRCMSRANAKTQHLDGGIPPADGGHLHDQRDAGNPGRGSRGIQGHGQHPGVARADMHRPIPHVAENQHQKCRIAMNSKFIDHIRIFCASGAGGNGFGPSPSGEI